MKKKILFTGGGSAGHVTVNLALIPRFLKDDWDIHYIGSENGIERQLIEPLKGVTYHHVSTGKLRRYFDWNNFKDPFKVIKGVGEAFSIIKREKPSVIFSKGGFVSVPVVIAGKMNSVPVIIHESDLTPGLANKVAIPFASKVCTTFPETVKHLPENKAEYIGAVVRDELKSGNRAKGLSFSGFTGSKPVMLIMGGSLGAKRINEAVRNQLDELLKTFDILHLTGKGQVDSTINMNGYKQFEYVTDELPDLLATADLIISRAGSNSIFEFLALKKPMLLIPLSRAASRGDQILNAQSFEKSGYANVLLEEDLTEESFMKSVRETYQNRGTYIHSMEQDNAGDQANKIEALIKNKAK
ncbi:undecaprenyldiphospho-muramoylpentapeptide beta-N-acetylglucosaminyltransferase [Guptibacillus hwajinpoensis]|uniref:undecaprenyldiphospho-muramoylpentapeptide beta-N-acetylglucosaminyltransferase n=1 Tax=Guptibacillus hwajinpoensis TaxID=208199 RepID=UPI00265731F2|nr:undecaprenyldiphospho-muramoylpentapeptide beta-N-acetylglucosaminyltransferase [Alkalihalobacillus hemicentroti]